MEIMEIKRTADDVAGAFDIFLQVYERFREDNGLTKNVDNAFEICTALTDKNGRIARQVKHAERNDHKEDWPVGMTSAMSGWIIYMIMLLTKYNVDIKAGMVKELKSSLKQYKTKK